MQHNLNVQDDDQSFVDSGTFANNKDNSVIEMEKLEEEKKPESLEEDEEENKMNKHLDALYEKSSSDIRKGMNRPSTFSMLKSESVTLKSESEIDFEELVTQAQKPKTWLITVTRISYIILFASAIMLFVISWYLSRQEITQLVGQSIPQVTAGFGVLTILILVLGVVANRRSWSCGFTMQSLCLVVLLLSETIVICVCVFQKYEILFNSDIYWTSLNDNGKARVMANWQCCGWFGTCDISDKSSVNYQYRHFQGTACLPATESETTKWTNDVAIILGSFVLFDILYMIYTVTCHSKRLKRARKNIVKKAADEKRKKAQKRRKSSFSRLRSISRFRPSKVARRLSRVSVLSPRLRNRPFGRQTITTNIMSSEIDVAADNASYK